MRKIKVLAVALILGLAGMVYAAGSMRATIGAQEKGKAEACCCCDTSGDACNMKSHQHGDSHKAAECCEMGKGEKGCCDDKGCCAAMAEHGKSGGEHHEGGCCAAHHSGDKSADKDSCNMGKEGAAGCCQHGDGGGCKAKTAKS